MLFSMFVHVFWKISEGKSHIQFSYLDCLSCSLMLLNMPVFTPENFLKMKTFHSPAWTIHPATLKVILHVFMKALFPPFSLCFGQYGEKQIGPDYFFQG